MYSSEVVLCLNDREQFQQAAITTPVMTLYLNSFTICPFLLFCSKVFEIKLFLLFPIRVHLQEKEIIKTKSSFPFAKLFPYQCQVSHFFIQIQKIITCWIQFCFCSLYLRYQINTLPKLSIISGFLLDGQTYGKSTSRKGCFSCKCNAVDLELVLLTAEQRLNERYSDEKMRKKTNFAENFTPFAVEIVFQQ